MTEAQRLRLEKRLKMDSEGNPTKRKAKRVGDKKTNVKKNMFSKRDIMLIKRDIQIKLNNNTKTKLVDERVAKKFGCKPSTITYIRRGKSHYNDVRMVQTADYKKGGIRKKKEVVVIEEQPMPNYDGSCGQKDRYAKPTEEQKVKTQSILNMFG